MGAEEVIERIRRGFSRTTRPADPFLIGSHEGCEPEASISAFFGRDTWEGIEADVLDANYEALSFFSEAGFRFFLPAFLVADVRGLLLTADPAFHLTHHFHDVTVETQAGGRTFSRRVGPRVLLNPRRYGAIRWEDHARFRLAVFTREECDAIVGYLLFRRGGDNAFDAPAIDAALAAFWYHRAAHAPTADDLARHLTDEDEFHRALLSRDP